MEANKFIACAGRLHPLQVMHVTFSPGRDSVTGLQRLIGLTRTNPAVRIEESIMAGLLVVSQLGEWQRISRTVPVYGMMHAKSSFLAGIARDVDNVACGQHLASGLFASKQIRREQAFEALTTAVLTQDFLAEMKGWGLTAEAFDINYGELPAFNLLLFPSDPKQPALLRVILDGWSGRAMVGEQGFSDVRFSTAGSFQVFVREALERKLEAVTTTAD